MSAVIRLDVLIVDEIHRKAIQPNQHHNTALALQPFNAIAYMLFIEIYAKCGHLFVSASPSAASVLDAHAVAVTLTQLASKHTRTACAHMSRGFLHPCQTHTGWHKT